MSESVRIGFSEVESGGCRAKNGDPIPHSSIDVGLQSIFTNFGNFVASVPNFEQPNQFMCLKLKVL